MAINVLVLGDIHCGFSALKIIREHVGSLGPAYQPDLVLATGDFTNTFGIDLSPSENEEAREIVQEIEKEMSSYECPVICVPGNHDRPDLWGVEGCLNSIDLLAGRSWFGFGGFRFLGFGGSWPIGQFVYEWEDDEALAERLDAAMPEPDGTPEILLSHVPPIDCGNGTLVSGEEVGSRALKILILDRQPFLNVCGHVHEGAGWGALGKTFSLNAGAIQGPISGADWSKRGFDPKMPASLPSDANFCMLRLDEREDFFSGFSTHRIGGEWVLGWRRGDGGDGAFSDFQKESRV